MLPLTEPRHELALRLLRALADLPVPKDLIVLSPEEWETKRHLPGTIAYPADREGLILYVKLAPMNIRPFQPTDEGQVIGLWRQCDLVVPWNDPHRDIRLKLEVQPELFLVGLVDGQIVATVMAGYEGHRGWLNYLAVDPELRGQGLGRRIAVAAESELRKLGCPKINLQIRSGNQAVIEFYRKLGFGIDDVVSMGKRL